MQVGDRVEISGLQSRPELNGEEGTVISPINTTGRYGVRLTTSNEKVKLKGHNLAPSRQAATATNSNNMSKTTEPTGKGGDENMVPDPMNRETEVQIAPPIIETPSAQTARR